MPNLTVQIRDVYGNTLVYPDCVKSRLLSKLIGRKTFTPKDIEILEQLDYEFTAARQNVFNLQTRKAR